MTRRRLLRALAALGGGAVLFAACRAAPSPPPESPPPARPTPSPRPATASPAPPTASPEPPPEATRSPEPPSSTAVAAPARVYVPSVSRDPTPPPTVPPQPAPPARGYPAPASGYPAPATQTPRPAPPSPTPPPPTLGTPRPTDTPRPTPPPAPTPGPRLPITKTTKWGLGVYREGNEVFEDLYVAKPTTILLMDPTEGWAKRVRGSFPKAFVVGRLFRRENAQPLDNPGPGGAAFADEVARLAVPLKGVVDAWMSYNEVVGHDAFEDYRRYNEFQVAFARRLQDEHGIPAVAGNDGSGAVEPADYPRYFAEAIRASRYLGLHAYSPPGSHRMRDAAEWHALRYRKVHQALEAAGIRDKPMVITESGLGDGWLGRVDDVIMAEEFFWFTDELQQDRYVIGHAAYGLFGGVVGDWRNFELRATDVLTRMGYYEPPPRTSS